MHFSLNRILGPVDFRWTTDMMRHFHEGKQGSKYFLTQMLTACFFCGVDLGLGLRACDSIAVIPEIWSYEPHQARELLLP